MLVSEGKTMLKRAGFDNSDPLLLWLNAGLHEFERAHDWSFLELETNLSSIPIGTSTLTVPSGFVKIHSIRDTTNNRKLQFITSSEFERIIDSPSTLGLPELYRVIGSDQIKYYPTNDEVTNFHIVYRSRFAEMTSDGAQMPGPSDIHYTIVQAAKYIALQDESEEDRAANAQAQFESSVLRLWEIYSTEQNDEPGQVTDVMGYGC